MATILNYTPHTITLMAADGTVAQTWPSVGLARVTSRAVVLPELAPGVPAVSHEWSAVEGLPTPQDGVLYAVSTMVADRSDRTDLVVPDSGPGSVVRDAEGQIIGVRRFAVPVRSR